ncbi:hypothetical protein CYMTET_28158 [Cymbomonas tetramitiformis]|uniref:Uncharacterized protein n=1 Tax=Cymbomonas tetramitiformis TaxID=36881 RepID=A0AAE0FPW6_9CHLO|nr:hypothetical protein CYMTET_28158 [Cymbomonas tetramitiformis]
MVLKNGRSGSTWLGSLLRKIDGVYFQHETISKKTGASMARAFRRDHLITGLLQPTGPANSPNNIEAGASPRTHRCIWTQECSLKAVGYSMCPSTDKGLLQDNIVETLTEVLSAVPWTKVLIFLRTNVVKTGLASHGTGHRKCISECRERYPKGAFMCELPHLMKYNENLYHIMVRAFTELYSIRCEAGQVLLQLGKAGGRRPTSLQGRCYCS